MENFLCSTANCLLECSKDLVLKHICYVIRAGEYVKALEEKMELLRQMRSDVIQRIQTEERQQRVATQRVKGWQRRLDDLERDVNQIVIDHNHRSCRSCFGGCSSNCCFNYQIGRKAFKKLQVVEIELQRGESLGEVTVEAPLPPVQEMPSTSTVPGLEQNLEAALHYLCDNGVKEELLGIWGAGGIGKTSLLNKINNSLAGNPSGFNHVISIVASKACTTEKLQLEIIKKLRLSEGGDTTAVIFNYLSNKNFVLLLDDVWERLDLKEVGIPHPLGVFNQFKRKVILTTRSETVCGLMGAHEKIRVDYLKPDDAWRLFLNEVGEKVVLNSHPSIPGLAKKVVEECNGLPLALVTIGRAMSSKKTPQEWNHALGLLQKSQLLQGTEEKLFSRLKLSYDYLENKKMQECLLCCSMWPEDFEIKNEELIECWMGHGLIEGFDNINEAYNEGHSIIGSLQAACLLEPVDMGNIIYESAKISVKMHDMIRDLALWIVSERGEKWMVHAGVELQEPPQEAERWNEVNRVSLPYNHFKEALPSTIRSSCQNLTTLLLQGNRISNPNGFRNLQYFHKLKYLDLSSNRQIKNFPIEICRLGDLEYLNLSTTSIRLLPEELKNLVNLKYLLLRDTNVSSLPDDVLSNLKKLLVLDVFSLDILDDQYSSKYRSILDQLDCMKGQLKALGITVSAVSDLYRLIGIPITALHIQRMEGMTSLQLLSLLERYNSALKELEISKCDDVEELIIPKNNPLSLLEFLYIGFNQHLKEVKWEGVALKDMLPMLRVVHIYECHELTHTTWAQHLPCLERLVLGNCKNMMKVISKEVEEREEIERPSFPRLRILVLHNLPELSSICDCALNFPSLEYLMVYKCPKLKELPFKVHTIHSKLRNIRGEDEWWDSLQWRDDNIRFSLLPFFEA